MLPKTVHWSLKKKFSLILVVIFLPASLLISFLSYRQEYSAWVKVKIERARLVAQSLSDNWALETAPEQKKEQKKKNKSKPFDGLSPSFCLAFDPKPVLMGKILKENPYIIRYVSLTPLNPKNRADSFEQKGINILEQAKTKDEYIKVDWFRGDIRYLKPVWRQDFCLQCHPGKLRKKKIQGAISIIIPAQSLSPPLGKNLERSLLLNFSLLGLMMAAWLIFAKVLISDRLEKLSVEMAMKYDNDCKKDVYKDEIGAVFSAFYLLKNTINHQIQSVIKEANLYKSLTRSAVYGMIVVDAKGKILFFNEGAERIFGWKKEQIHEVTLLIPPKLRLEYSLQLKQQLNTWEPIEILGLRKNGEEFFASVSLGEMTEGRERLFTAIIQDITEQKRKEGEITKQNKKLALLNQVSTELLLERDLKKLAEYSLDESLELTDSLFGLFLLKNKDGNLVPLTTVGLSSNNNQAEDASSVFRPIGVLGEILRQRKPQIINTPLRNTQFKSNWPGGRTDRTVLVFDKFSFYSFLGVPIISEQEVIGVICVANRPDGYTDKQEGLLTALANDLSLLIVRNAVEKETRILEEKFQTLFDQSSDMMLICTLEGRIQAVNYRVVQYTGYKYQELIDYGFCKLYLPDEERKCKKFLRLVSQQGNCRVESCLRQKNGGSFPVDLQANIVSFGGQKVIHAVARDIVQFKNKEDNLKIRLENLMKKLEEQRKKNIFLRMAVNALPEYVLMTDRTGRILFANSSFCRRFGYSVEELVGQPVEFLFKPDLSIDVVDQIITQALQGGWKGKVAHLTKDGESIHLELTIQGVQNQEGGVLGLLGIYRASR